MVARRKQEEAACVQCGAVFRPWNDTQTACSPLCLHMARAGWIGDTPFKRVFLAECTRRRITAKAASLETGVSYSTIRSWLKRRRASLRLASTERVAAWLSITTAEAVALQGGTGEDKQRANAGAARATDAYQQYQHRLKHDPAFKRQQVERMAAANRGRPLPAELREKLRITSKRAIERIGTAHLAAGKRTLRGRAQQMVRSLRWHHPTWTPGQVAAEAARRLMQPPYNRTAAQAATLIAPRASQRLIRRRAMRHPHRYRIMQDLDGLRPRTTSGKRWYGYVQEFERQVRAIEGDATPDYTALQKWLKRQKIGGR